MLIAKHAEDICGKTTIMTIPNIRLTAKIPAISDINSNTK